MVLRVEMHQVGTDWFGIVRWRKLGQVMPVLRFGPGTREALSTWVKETCKAIENGTDPQPLLINLDQ